MAVFLILFLLTPDINDNVDIHDVAPDGSKPMLMLLLLMRRKDGDVKFLPLPPFTGNPGLNVQIPDDANELFFLF